MPSAPGPPSASPSPTTPGPALMLARAALGRCPVCGQGQLFRQWFTMVEDCPRCELRFERIEGHWVGALGMNTVLSFGALAVVVVVGLILSAPEFEIVPLLVTAALV